MNWQKILANGFSDVKDLLNYLELPDTLAPTTKIPFKTRVPLDFAARMEKKNPLDPLLLQVLMQQSEASALQGYTKDPLEEDKFTPIPGLIHKYQSRVLLTFGNTCAINCRYCFRRHFPYSKNNVTKNLMPAIDYIRQNKSITEVILSGGDPMLAKDASFKILLINLAALDHITTLRLHSRIPVVLPERITKEWLELFKNSSFNKVMVIHTNHANELSLKVKSACALLKNAANFHLLNQGVLLKGVNDNAESLAVLSEKLFSYGILPYYLHLLDKVAGAQHFAVAEDKAKKIYKALQKKLPGYLVPRLVKEEPFMLHKTLII